MTLIALNPLITNPREFPKSVSSVSSVVGFAGYNYPITLPNHPTSVVPEPQRVSSPPLARRLGLFDATMLVMGGTIGAMVILISGSYERILDYVTSMDWIFFGLSASCLFLLRRRAPAASGFLVPGHPWTTALFCLACAAVVANTIYRFPGNTLIGLIILAAGLPVYYIWRWFSRTNERLPQ